MIIFFIEGRVKFNASIRQNLSQERPGHPGWGIKQIFSEGGVHLTLHAVVSFIPSLMSRTITF